MQAVGGLSAEPGIAFDPERELRHKREVRYPAKGDVSSRRIGRMRNASSEWVGGTVNRRFLFLVLIVCGAGAAACLYVFQQRLETATEFDRQVKLAKEEAGRIREEVILPTEKRVPAGENFAAALQKFGLSAEEAANASAAAQRTFNLRQVRA